MQNGYHLRVIAISLFQIFFQIEDRFPVTLQSMTLDSLDTGKSGVGDLTEAFPGIHIRDMYFHSGKGNRLQRIQDCHGSVGVRCGIDDNAIHFSVGPLDLVYKITLVVRLILFNFQSFGNCRFFQQKEKILKGMGKAFLELLFQMVWCCLFL